MPPDQNGAAAFLANPDTAGGAQPFTEDLRPFWGTTFPLITLAGVTAVFGAILGNARRARRRR